MREWVAGLIKEATLRKSYAILIGCFGFLAGVLLHSFLDTKVNFFWIYNAELALVIFIILFWKEKKIRLALLGVFFILLGFARFNFSIAENKILPEFWNKEVEIMGVISDEPINKINKQQLAILPETINGSKFFGSEKILVSAGLYPKHAYGGKIIFTCKLQEPKSFDDFDYAKYLSIQNVYGLCYYPAITRTDADLHADLYGHILKFKNFLIEKLNAFLPEPAASFASGLVLGARGGMPQKLLDNFSKTGTMHIIAISGWNITFLGTIFLPLLFSLHIKRGKAFYIMVVLIFLYALLVGFGASVFRAAVMGVIALLAQKTGRRNHAGRALLYAAALMFLINPRLAYDIGFWLSAAAAFGLIYFPPVAERVFGLNNLRLGFLTSDLSATISAVIFTLPVSALAFGNFSIWTVFVNLIILPFVALVIPLVLAALPAAILLPHLARWFFLPPAAILNYIMGAVNFFAAAPFGFFSLRVNLPIALALYAGLIYYTFWESGRLKSEPS